MNDGIGVLYRLRWLRCKDAGGYFVPVGHGPATRPGVQHAFSFQLRRGIDFEQVPHVEAIEFRHDDSASREIMARFDQGKLIYPAECIVDVVRKLRDLPFATMAAIKHAIGRDVADSTRIDALAEKTAVAISTELNIDVVDGHSLELEANDTHVVLQRKGHNDA